MTLPCITRFVFPLLLSSFLSCTPLKHREPWQRRQSRGVVSGVDTRDEDGNVYIRREVRDLYENYPDQWNLYLLALEKLHWVSQDDPYSYFGLASIHGRPYRVWEGARGLEDKIGIAGYCPHNNQLFITWHRPYLALFEQVLYEHMLDIAWTAPPDDLDRYLRAADSWRLPYWDWARGDTEVPWFFMEETISIREPSGDKALIWNPLYTFRFQEVPSDEFEDKFRYIDRTVRWPNSSDPSAGSHQEAMQSSYASQSPSIVEEMGTVFRSSTFVRFASRVEEPHGWMHGVIGGNWNKPRALQGHFWPLEYAGFDPLFMLHHANVDRLAALYQAAHPDRWMRPTGVGSHGNVFIQDGEIIDGDTPLLPFRKDSGDFWTSNDCRDHTVLGYTYPELQWWLYESDEDFQSAVTSYISKTYYGTIRGLLFAHQQSAVEANLLTENRTFIDWTIEASAVTSLVPSTFVVQFFFISDGGSTQVGTWMQLMPSDHPKRVMNELRYKRVSSEGQKLEGTVTLTSQLIRRIGNDLVSLDPKDVVPFLKDRLTWSIHNGDGQLLNPEQVGAFSFQIFSGSANIPEDETQPIIYDDHSIVHPEATGKKTGDIAA